MLFRSTKGSADDSELTPEEWEAYLQGLERVREEKLRALRDPGPTWGEWFFYDAMKWLVGLTYLIVDSWIVVSWIGPSSVAFVPLGLLGLVGSLAGAVYLELLLYRYLWRRPQSESAGPFRPGWLALREIGRWTPEEAAIRAGKAVRRPTDGSVDSHEFL